MEADGEHNTRGTENTVTNEQRLDQLEDMVRELYRHVVGNEYSEGETPGPSGNFSNASMGFGANTVDEEFAVENALDEKSIVTTPKDASDEESGVTGGSAQQFGYPVRDVSKALEISSANTPDNGSSVDGASVNSGDQEKSL